MRVLLDWTYTISTTSVGGSFFLLSVAFRTERWSQCLSSPLPLGTCLRVYHAWHSQCSSIMVDLFELTLHIALSATEEKTQLAYHTVRV